MNRRMLAFTLIAALCALTMQAAAQTTADQLIRRLRAEGFDEIEMSRTLLGRVRITAEGPPGEREIILNPASGTILRDYYDRDDDADRAKDDGRPDDRDRGKDRGKDDDRDDEDDDDDEDDEDADDDD